MSRVLVACEYSGIVRDALIRAGIDAVSCDLLPSESDLGDHYCGDVRDILWSEGWRMIIAHPDCTYLTNAGVRWMYEGGAARLGRGICRERYAQMVQAANFFRLFLDHPCARVAVENPVMHFFGTEIIGRGPDQVVQPWQFGHGETKGVAWWLKNLPPLQPTNIVDGREARVHRMPPGPDRKKERSRFFTGIGDAIASQWGALL